MCTVISIGSRCLPVVTGGCFFVLFDRFGVYILALGPPSELKCLGCTLHVARSRLGVIYRIVLGTIGGLLRWDEFFNFSSR